MELEPHGSERGEVIALMNARKVERELNAHPWIATSFVAGPEPMANAALLSLRSHPVFAWSQQQQLRDGNWESLLDRPQLAEPLLQRVRAIGHKHGMTLEPVILKRGLSPETGEITPRGELRRALILRRAGSYVQPKRPQ
jgi:long-subunit acyl-CoA synthetase (AMP-forming)